VESGRNFPAYWEMLHSVSKFLTDYTASYPRRWLSSLLLWDDLTVHVCIFGVFMKKYSHSSICSVISISPHTKITQEMQKRLSCHLIF